MIVYLDNNATTPLSDPVKKKINESFELYGNPSSFHSLGVKARNVIEIARGKIAAAIGSDAKEVLFTSCGTESDNIAIQGLLKSTKKKHIVSSKIEHPAVLNVIKYFEASGYDVSWVDVDRYGRVNPEDVAVLIRPDTAIVSIMMANNEIGTIQPIKEITDKVKEVSKDVIIHTDAVQAFGKVKFKVRELGVDMLSISSHKVNGPKGVGALYIRKGLKISPILYGGHHEKGIKPGTENILGIVGFGEAASQAVENIEYKIGKIRELKERLKNGINRSVDNIEINGHPDEVLSNTLNVSFKGIEGESIIMMLDMEGICVATGSACSSGRLEPSHVLMSMGLDPAVAQGSVRFSLGDYNTLEEIDYVVEKLPPIIERLREISPLEIK